MLFGVGLLEALAVSLLQIPAILLIVDDCFIYFFNCCYYYLNARGEAARWGEAVSTSGSCYLFSLVI